MITLTIIFCDYSFKHDQIMQFPFFSSYIESNDPRILTLILNATRFFFNPECYFVIVPTYFFY